MDVPSEESCVAVSNSASFAAASFAEDEQVQHASPGAELSHPGASRDNRTVTTVGGFGSAIKP